MQRQHDSAAASFPRGKRPGFRMRKKMEFGWGCSSAVRVSDGYAADPGSILISRRGKGFVLPESTFSADSLTVSVHPRVQSHALISVRELKIS